MKFFNHFRWYDVVVIGVIVLINLSATPNERATVTFLSTVMLVILVAMIHIIEIGSD